MSPGAVMTVDRLLEDERAKRRKKKYKEAEETFRQTEALLSPVGGAAIVPPALPAPPVIAAPSPPTISPREKLRKAEQLLQPEASKPQPMFPPFRATPNAPIGGFLGLGAQMEEAAGQPQRAAAIRGAGQVMGGAVAAGQREQRGTAEERRWRAEHPTKENLQIQDFRLQWQGTKQWAEERAGHPLSDDELLTIVNERPEMFPKLSGWKEPGLLEGAVQNLKAAFKPTLEEGPPGLRFLSSPAGAASLLVPALRVPTLFGIAGEEAAGTVAHLAGAPAPVETAVRVAAGVLTPGAGIIRSPGKIVMGAAETVERGAGVRETIAEVSRRVSAGEDLIDIPVRQLWDATGSLTGRNLELAARELSRRGTEFGEQISRQLPGTGALAPLVSGEEGFLRIPFITKRAATPAPDLFVIGTSKGEPVAGRVLVRSGRRFTIELPDGSRVVARRGALGVTQDVAAAEQFLRRAQAGESIDDLMREFQTPASKLTNALRAAARLEAELVPEYEAFRKQVAGKMGGILRSGRYQGTGGTQKYIVAQGAQAGGPRKDMTALSRLLSEDDLSDLTGMIDRHFSAYTARNFDWKNTGIALTDMFLKGRKPMPFERKLLSEVFGDELGEVLAAKTLGQRAIAEFWETLNVPRVVLASFDLSAPLRQGVMLLPGHPKESARAFGRMVQAFFSEDAAKYVDDAIRRTATYDLKQEAKLYLAPLAGEIEEREELYMSRLLQQIPVLGAGVKASERAYITYLNKLRSDVFDTVHANWVGQGKTLEDYTALADFINKASGRGTIPPHTAKWLSAAFFAPRFAVSRPQAFLSILSKSPSARTMAMRDMGLFVGTGVGVLGMLKTAAEVGGWDMDVEVDPRSTDFGKIRIGSTRLDFWGGAQQWVRYAAQLLPQISWADGIPSISSWQGARKAGSGFVYDVGRLSTLSRFFRSKLSPQAGFLIDWLGGETFIGDEMLLSPGNVKLQLFNRFVPMAWQDLIDSVRMYGWKGAWVGIPSGLGLGTLTYKTPFDRMLEVRRGVMQDMNVTQAQVDLDPGLAARVDKDQRVRDAQAELDADLLRHGATGPSAFYAHSRTLRREAEAEQLLDDERLEKGAIDKGDWRYRTMERSGSVYNAIEGMRRVAGVEPGDQDIPEGPINTAVSAYFAVDVKDYTDEKGFTDWYSFNNARAGALDVLAPEQRTAALQAIHKYATPRAMLMHEDLDYVAQKGMFGIDEWLWKQVAPTKAPLPVFMNLMRQNIVNDPANRDVDVTDDDVRSWMAANVPEYADYLRRVLPTQYNWRWDNPEGEARAYRAGVIDKILSPQAALIYFAWTGEMPDDFKSPPTEYKERAYQREMLEGG